MNSKRCLLFIAVVSCFVVCFKHETKAQDYGLKGGLVISTVNGQTKNSFKPGMQLGIYKNFGSTERLFVQMEALLTQKGSWNWDNENQNNINLYYFDFALMFGISLQEKLTFNLGIQPSIFLGGNYKYTNNGEEQKESLSGRVSRMDYATLFGLEYAFNKSYTLGARFNYSFVPLQSYENDFADNNELPYLLVGQIYMKVKMDKLKEWIK